MLKINKSIIQSFFFIMTVLLVLTGVICGFYGIENSAFLLSFFSLFLLFMINIFLNRMIGRKAIAIIAIAALILGWLTLVLTEYNGDAFPFALFIFAGTLMLYSTSSTMVISRKTMRVFMTIGLIASILFVIVYVRDGYLWEGMGKTVRGFNPQHIGIWAYIFSCVGLIAFDILKHKIIKCIDLLLICYMIIIMIESRTRAALVSFFFVLLFWIFPIKKFLQSRLVQIIFSCMPGLIAIVAILFWQFGFGREWFGGSFLNGREAIWKEELALAFRHPFIGNYATYYEEYTHNVFVEHALFYGLIIAFLFIYLTYKTIHIHCAKLDNQVSYDGLICFLGCLLLSSQENMIFSAACGGVFVLSCSFLIIMSNKENKPTVTNIFMRF